MRISFAFTALFLVAALGHAEESPLAPLVPFSDPLVIPPRLVIKKGQREVTVRLTELSQRVYAGASGPTRMWGYNGTSPGPTIEVEKNQPLRIHWKNDLPTHHVLPAAPGAMTEGPIVGSRVVFDGAKLEGMPEMTEGPANLPEVRNVTHLHGAAVWSTDPLNRLHNNDGWADAWNVPGQQQIADYPNVQSARTLWYHDHAMGVTGRNVAAGMAGMYLIRDSYERSLNLPKGSYEIPLILQAVSIDAQGGLHYTPHVWQEFYGNAVAINGKVRPVLEVEPRKYRFRIVNASNARLYGLKLLDYDNGTPGPAFYQIGTDSGFLEKTAILNDPNDNNAPFLYLAPGERADVIIDFSQYAGKSLMLRNIRALTDPDQQLPIPQLMLVKVKNQLTAKDASSLPMQMQKIWPLDPKKAAQTRRIVLSQMDHPDGSSMFMLDNRNWFYKKTDACGDYWDYAIDVKPVLGTTEVWELTNTTVMLHPFHIHLVQFQVLDRRLYDVKHYNQTGEIVYTGPAEPPDANETGWKDVVRAPPMQITRIIMRFGPYPGYFMYHCHILEHEDMDMMIPFQVVKPTGTEQSTAQQ